MIISMTGFGKGSASTATKKITVEIKSLNSKQLDLSLRVPGCVREAEPRMRAAATAELKRGKADLIVSIESVSPDAPAALNIDALRAYKSQIEEASARLGIAEPADWWTLLTRMPEAMRSETPQQETDEEVEAAMLACEEALRNLTLFREQDGKRLSLFFTEKIANIRKLLEEVAPLEAERVPRIRQRLEEQLAKLTGVEINEGRLEQEMIFYIEKLDIAEEKLRLGSHLDYFLATLHGEPGQGKKLGFIAQEMGREINTLGSKSNHAGMQQIVVRMKDELEQIKEQVLNVL